MLRTLLFRIRTVNQFFGSIPLGAAMGAQYALIDEGHVARCI
jgi:hypothetical protein